MPRSFLTGVTDYFSEMMRMRELGNQAGFQSGFQDQERVLGTAWVPAADIFTRGDDVVIRIELPGMTADQVEISLATGVLTIAGERRTEIGADPDSFSVRERYHGAFRRVLKLPEDVEPGDVTATFAEGLVEIVVAGAARSNLQRIPVSDRSSPRSERRLR